MGKLGLEAIYMIKRKHVLTALVIGCLATMCFVDEQNVRAADAVIKNKARIDTEYPLGASSDFLMVAGNQFKHSQSIFNGRIMANSIQIAKGNSNDPVGINNSMENTSSAAEDNYFEHLANPAIIINDFNKSTDDNMKNVIYHLSTMWQTKNQVPVGLSNNTQFATDTSKEAAVNKFSGLSVDLFNGQKGTVADLWDNNKALHLDGGLANLKQYVDNGVNKYETSPTPAVGDYSLQQNIQDVSDTFAKLTPTTGNDTKEFWSSTDEIVDLKQSDDSGSAKSNPIYMPDVDSQLSDVVVNITAKADISTTTSVAKPYTGRINGQKPVVAVLIDRKKMTDNNPNAQHINLVFNFSDSFYTRKNGKKLLDPDKIPYIVINYCHFGTNRFNFGSGDGFYIGDIHNKTATISNLGADGYVRSIATEVGAPGINDWDDPAVLKFGSQMINNFTDTYDATVSPGDDITQDSKGIDGNTAAVSYTNRRDGSLLFGTMLIPKGSYYAGSESAGLYVGGIIAANNITLNNAKISRDHDKAVFGNNHDFPGLGPSRPPITIDSLNLVNPQKVSQKVVSGETAEFSYSDDDLIPAPNLGITGILNLANTPDSYGLYYRYNSQDEWRRYSDGAQTKNTVVLDEDFLAKLNNQSKTTAGSVTTTAQKISYPLTKNNRLEFATTTDAKEETIAADKIETTATFNFTLQVKAPLEVTVPARISFGTHVLGSSSGEATRTVAINEIQLAQKAVADTGTSEAPKVIVYNPLLNSFNLKLAYLDADDTSQNPFYITNNFKYNINAATPLPLAPDKSLGEWIDGVLKRTTEQSLETRMRDNPLKMSSLQLHLPYRNDYKISTAPYEAPMGWQLTL